MRLIPAPDALRCLVCGPAREGGLDVGFALAGDRVEATWRATSAMEGWAGLAHGATFAALHDDAAHWAMIALAARTGFTTRMDVRFLRPIRIGDRVRISGRVAEVGEKRGSFASELALDDGTLASTAVTEYAFVEDPGTLTRILGRELSPFMRKWLASDAATRRELVVERARGFHSRAGD